MAYKPVGVDENGKFPARVQASLVSLFVPRIANSVVAYDAQDRPLTETIPISGGNLVKTYTYNSVGDPATCAWDFPGSLPDYLETFNYDSLGRPVGSTFTGA